jgi:peptidoglycan/xylan/chitin deacetylase (PgdA/CDA1 family)
MVLWSFRVPVALTVTVGFLAALVHATPLPGTLERRQGLAQIISSCTVPNTVALTFDDGPYIYLRVRI